ncbi:MAG TPA: aspartyl/asparaginyl beta-hydroxylase domain-containing protein [Xanthomonadales bacterium]|nr:aspartyl/asparaginyl beta-hydroxylase domain-containing protein [Xanthomonadales bacterium]
MKLETEFVKLPLLFDVAQLREEVAQFSEDEWMGHTTGFAGNLSIPLISLDGEYNDAMHGPMRPTPALARCEYIRQIMTTFGDVFGRSRLMRVEPGFTVPPHVDVNYHWFNRVRIHIPITTTGEVLFYTNGKHVHMAAGEAWIFDSWSEHTVENNSDKTRVHLVLDTSGSTLFWDLVERGEWPFRERSTTPSEPKFVSFEPGKATNVRTETYNAPVVQSPGELEVLIRALVDSTDCKNDSDEQTRDAFAKITRTFVRSWRQVWSEHAMKPSGWPHYHALVNQVNQFVLSLNPELALKSGVDLIQAFQGLVLSSAVNEEFAPLYLEKSEVPGELQQATRSYVPRTKQAKKPIPRNAPCPCDSGKRYKQCCGQLNAG